MVALNHDRTGAALVAVERTAGDSRDGLSIYNGLAVEHHGYNAADQRDIERLPLARRLRRPDAGREEAVDTGHTMHAQILALVVFDLDLVSAAQVDTAVVLGRIPEFHVQLE